MQSIPMERSQAQVRVNTFVRSVYNWMAIGLALTGGVAWFVVQSPELFTIARKGFFLFAIAELGLVFWLAARVSRMSASKATGLFILYAALNGVTMSLIFAIYTLSSIASTFFICAGTFAVCSIFGWMTKRDLTGLGNFMFMGLIGIIIATVINIFLRSPAMQMIISYIGVLVFTGLTAYDTQKLKSMAMAQPA